MSELLPCPFCGCALSVRSNRDWHRPEGDHGDTCPIYDSDLAFPATDHGLRALMNIWNSRAPAQHSAAAPVSGDVALPELPSEIERLLINNNMRAGARDLMVGLIASYARTYGQQCSDAALERVAKLADDVASNAEAISNFDIAGEARRLATTIRALKGDG